MDIIELTTFVIIYIPPIVPTLQRGNEDRDALASSIAKAVLRHYHAERHCH